MKKEQTYFVAFLFLLLILILFLDFIKPIAEGNLEKITIYPDHCVITLSDSETKIYIQNRTKLELKKENEILIYGKEEKYLNSSMIFADKIILKEK